MNQFLEDLDNAIQGIKNYSPNQDINSENLETNTSNVDPSDLSEMNRLYTPVLVRRKIEQDIATDTKLNLAESGQFNERSTVLFDNTANYDQLVNVAARVIAKRKNSPSWEAFTKASEAKKQADLNIQEENQEEAKSLANEYLVMASKSNSSSAARDAAMDLLSNK